MNQIMIDSLATRNYGGVIENMPTVPEVEFHSSKEKSIKTKPSTFNEVYQERLNSVQVAPVESISLNQIDTNSNSSESISNLLDFIFILIIVLLILWRLIYKGIIPAFFSKIGFRFSAKHSEEKFEKNVSVLKELLENGVISQSVYDSRMNDLLKRRLK